MNSGPLIRIDVSILRESERKSKSSCPCISVHSSYYSVSSRREKLFAGSIAGFVCFPFSCSSRFAAAAQGSQLQRLPMCSYIFQKVLSES